MSVTRTVQSTSRRRAALAGTPFGLWAERHATVISVAVAMALFLYDSMNLVVQHVGLGVLSVPLLIVALVLSSALCTAYVFRRRGPWVVPVLVYAGAWGYVVLGVGLSPAPLVVLGLLLYFVGARFGWRTALLAAALAGLWVVVAAQPLLAKEYVRIGEVGVLVLAGFFLATLGLLAQSRRGHTEALQERADQLARERDAREAIAAAEERARIAREIHDIVSHSLGTMVVMADGAAQTVASSPEQAGHAMERVRDTGRDAMGEMRRMLDVLRDDSSASRSPQPGLGRLDRLVEETRQTGLRVDLHIEGEPVALPAGLDLAAYRIVQESLTNARKHGGPLLSVVTVTLSYAATELSLRIVDDGSPAATGSAAEVPWTTGHGLVGMRERASAYGGSLEAGPRSDGGFKVHAVLPIGDER
ncbi:MULTISPECIES: sensor histidine kinase [Brachybacterium]|uniref:histidine kinase n=2 Tax=Brachybacterium TaxID=43668 RepID=A0A3R8QX90_9MICO|nr:MULTISPECIES: histidine kinase [Brachybacterium]MCT1436716.1 histidine kinase [Brachybacterium paraconglomeratum]RRR19969.1 sensor histidine kinase [Brachybacterium paraconglomeratum]GLI31815.1 two-component sensor histidine kinase [Brachybacterium conglomeratum]GLK03348.1 two-component sensor histidine kinase [Brachybacterium conglomeratum]